MTAPVRFIMLVIGLVIAGAILMAPRGNERLSMMLDDGKQAQVIALLEPRLAQGETDPTLLAMLGRSYAGLGNFDRASKLLERYTALRPDDADAYGRRADLYKSVGDQVNRIAMLERCLAIKPMLSRAEELAMLYREQKPGRSGTRAARAIRNRTDCGKWIIAASGTALCRWRGQ